MNSICYKHLILRNQAFEQRGQIKEDTEKVHLPFILVATEDSTDNEIDVAYDKDKRNALIEVKKEIHCIGDVDALMNLQFYRVHGKWLRQEVEDSSILSMIP